MNEMKRIMGKPFCLEKQQKRTTDSMNWCRRKQKQKSMRNFDGAIFFIINKAYKHAKLAQWGTGGRDIGTYEQRVYPDQLWRLEAEPEHPGYYYICNVQNDGYRIGKWGGDDQAVGNYNGQYFDDQLWKFEKYGDFYRIFNYKYEDAKIAKWGKGDSDWGTFDGKFFDDQLWKLTSLFESSLTKASVLTIDNRQGSENVIVERSVTKGVKLTTTSSLSIKEGFKASLKYSASLEIGRVARVGMEEAFEICQEIESSLSNSSQEQWSETTKVTFTAPKGVNYRVTQWQLNFRSWNLMLTDNCQGQVLTKIKIEETNGEFS